MEEHDVSSIIIIIFIYYAHYACLSTRSKILNLFRFFSDILDKIVQAEFRIHEYDYSNRKIIGD